MTNRFVILLHQTSGGNHWDVMLENGSALTTWSIPPQDIPEKNFTCQTKRLPDHRMVYLDYEGEISGGRGNISRVDAGTYEALSVNRFALHGAVFLGFLTIDGDNGVMSFIHDITD
jgi:hypothetical protein